MSQRNRHDRLNDALLVMSTLATEIADVTRTGVALSDAKRAELRKMIGKIQAALKEYEEALK